MSGLFKVNFIVDDVKYFIHCEAIDYEHPYFVNLIGLSFPEMPKGYGNAAEQFKNIEQIMVPVQQVFLIAQIKENKTTFKIVEPLDRELEPLFDDTLIMFPKINNRNINKENLD